MNSQLIRLVAMVTVCVLLLVAVLVTLTVAHCQLYSRLRHNATATAQMNSQAFVKAPLSIKVY